MYAKLDFGWHYFGEMSIAQYSNITHQTNTCLKSTAVKLAKGVKYVQSSL